MRILISNDDGINAPGLRVLSSTLSKEHEIYVSAPSENNSGASCKFGIFQEVSVNEADLGEYGVKKALSVGSTPVDSVFVGLKGSFLPQIDAVISGINSGPNLGTDIIYSGTCGAARFASLMGYPSIALSIDGSVREQNDSGNDFYFENLAEFTLKNLKKLISLCGEKTTEEGHAYCRTFLNINAPAFAKYNGAKLANPCIKRYVDKLEIKDAGPGKFTVKIEESNDFTSFSNSPNDFEAIKKGFVAVSRIFAEPAFLKDEKETSGYLAL